MRPLKKMGINYSVADVSLTDDKITLKNFENAIMPNTKLVFCTGASNVCGRLLPISKIGELCKTKKIMFGIDAAQIAGVIPIDMKKMNIDFLCVAAHKGLYAPMGLGVLICRKHIPDTIIEGGTGTNSLDLFQPKEMPERLESGTINVPAIIGFGAGIDFVNKHGIGKLYLKEMQLSQYVYNSLAKNSNIELYTPKPLPWEYVPVIPFNFKGIESTKTAKLLDEYNIAVRAGYHCAPTAHSMIGTIKNGAVRLSFSAFNSIAESESFIRTLNDKNFLKKLQKIY
jgi:selenocysteine lyase/cysteine desulfurase